MAGRGLQPRAKRGGKQGAFAFGTKALPALMAQPFRMAVRWASIFGLDLLASLILLRLSKARASSALRSA